MIYIQFKNLTNCPCDKNYSPALNINTSNINTRMNKYIYALSIIISLLFCSNTLHSKTDTSTNKPNPKYTPRVDSLLNLINTTTGAELLKQYPRLHKALYEVNDIDVHLKYNQEFAEAAKAAKDKKMEAISHVLKIEALYNYRMPDSIMLKESLKALDFMRDVPGAEVHYFYTAATVSDIYMLEGNYEKALEFAKQFYNEAKEKKNSSGLVASLQTMGKAYEELGVLDKAEASFRESIVVANEKTDHGMKGESYSYLVDMLNGQKRYKDALKVNKEFEAYLIRIDAYNGELKNLCFLSDLGYTASYAQLRQYKLAWEYLSKAEKYPVASTSMGMYSVENERFRLLLEEGRYAEAELSANRLDKILDNDASYFKASLKMKEARADLYFRWGKFAKSADAYKDYIAKTDSVQRVEITTRLNSLRTQYEVDKLEIQKQQQERTFTNTLMWLSVALVLLCIIIAVIVVNARRLRAKNRSLLDRIKEQDELEEKYDRMRSDLAHNAIAVSPENEKEDNFGLLYVKLKELMNDQTVFTDPSINRKTIAEMLGTNEKYIFDVVKEFYGTNISDYINKLRLNYARNQLALPHDTRTIDTIALDAGFNSRSVFYRLFKEHYGMTPVEFRRLVTD